MYMKRLKKLNTYIYIYIYPIASKQLKQIIKRLPSTVSPIFSLFLHHTTPFLLTSSLFTKPSRYPPRMTIPPSPAGDLFGFIKVQKFYKTSRTVEAIIFPGQANRNPLAHLVLGKPGGEKKNSNCPWADWVTLPLIETKEEGCHGNKKTFLKGGVNCFWICMMCLCLRYCLGLVDPHMHCKNTVCWNEHAAIYNLPTLTSPSTNLDCCISNSDYHRDMMNHRFQWHLDIGPYPGKWVRNSASESWNATSCTTNIRLGHTSM